MGWPWLRRCCTLINEGFLFYLGSPNASIAARIAIALYLSRRKRAVGGAGDLSSYLSSVREKPAEQIEAPARRAPLQCEEQTNVAQECRKMSDLKRIDASMLYCNTIDRIDAGRADHDVAGMTHRGRPRG